MTDILQGVPARRRWRPAPLVAASMGLHGMAAASCFVPEAWPWAASTVVTNHAVLGALGLWPRSTLLGPNLTRLPPESAARAEVAITFDDGPEPEVTPRVLDLLDARAMHATFFCIAERAAAHAPLCREIVRRGHAIENHSCAHRVTFPFLGLRGFRDEILAAQEILTGITGIRPRFFRAPAGLRNPLLDPVLHELQLSLVSWTRRAYDTRRSDPQRVARDLAQGLAAGDILLLHDGQSARTALDEPVALTALAPLLDAIEAAGLRTVTLPQAIGA